MKKIIILTVLIFSLSAYESWAGFGDATSPFSSSEEETSSEEFFEESEEDNSATNSFGSEDKFGSKSFFNGGNEQIMGPPPPRPIPLDGGVSLLLIGGIALGIKKLLGKKQ